MLSQKGYDVYVLKGGILPHLSQDYPLKEPGDSADSRPVEKPDHEAAAVEGHADEQITALRAENNSLQENNASLTAELATERTAMAHMTGQIEQLRGELEDSTQEFGKLNARIEEHAKDKKTLENQIRALQEQQQVRLDEIQRTLIAEQDKNTVLKQQLAAESARRDAQIG